MYPLRIELRQSGLRPDALPTELRIHIGWHSRSRTCHFSVNSRMFYQLNYVPMLGVFYQSSLRVTPLSKFSMIKVFLAFVFVYLQQIHNFGVCHTHTLCPMVRRPRFELRTRESKSLVLPVTPFPNVWYPTEESNFLQMFPKHLC